MFRPMITVIEIYDFNFTKNPELSYTTAAKNEEQAVQVVGDYMRKRVTIVHDAIFSTWKVDSEGMPALVKRSYWSGRYKNV